MASPNKPSSSPRHSWRRERKTASESRGARIAKRLLLTALGAVLCAIFVFAIWTFITPGANLHFYSLAVADYSLHVPLPIAFSKQDRQAIEKLNNTAIVHELQQLDPRTSGHAEGMVKIGGRIKTRNKDVLIFYLNAHGVSDDGKPYVLCSDYDPAKNDSGRIPLTSLLEQIRRCPGQLKLVLLDTGRIRSDTRLGMAVNEFPQLLQSLELQDPNLWIMCSNSVGELSGSYHPERGSVFAHFVTQGLGGSADGYGNGGKKDDKVDLKEFWEYVRDHVSAWAETASAGADSQTPMFVRGDGSKAVPSSAALLIRLRKPKEEEKQAEKPDQPDKNDGPARADQDRQASLADPRSRLTYLANFQDETKKAPGTKPEKSDTTSDPKKKSKADQTPPEAQPGDQDDSDEAQTRPTSPKKGATPSDKRGGDSEPKESSDKSVTASGPAGLRLFEAWKFRDLMEGRLDGRVSPIDYAPHLWREFQEQLLSIDLRFRGGVSDAQGQEEMVARVLDLIQDMPRQLSRLEPKDVIRSLKARPHTLAVTRLFNWSDTDARQHEDFRKLHEQISDLVQLPVEEFPDQFSAWVASPEIESFRFISEIGMALRLKQRVDENPNDSQRWEKVQLALATRQQAEQAASAAAWCKPWVRKLVEDGDMDRAAGERSLFAAGDGSKQAMESLRSARLRYRAAQQNADAIRRAYELKNDLVFYAPHYVRFSDLFPPTTNIGQLLQDLRQLTVAMDEANVDRINEIKVWVESLKESRAAILAGVQSSVDVLSNNPAGRGNMAKIERLLSTALLSAVQRQKLADAAATAEKEAVKKLQEFTTIRAATSTPPRSYLDQLKLEIELARLVGKQSPQDAASGPATDTMLQAIEAADKAYVTATSSSGNAYWSSLRELGSALKRFYLAIPEAVQTSRITRETDLLQSRERLLRVLDARDVGTVRATIGTQDPIETIRQGNLFSLLAWHQERLDRLRQISAPAEREELLQAALLCNKLARAIPDQPNLEPLRSTPSIAAMECQRPDKLRLASPAPLAIKISPLQKQAAKASLMLVFDPTLIEINALTRNSPIAETTSFPIAIDLLPDDPRTFHFVVKAKKESDEVAIVAAQLLVGDRIESEETFKLNMPEPQVVELKVTGLTGTVRLEKRKFTLRPFPGHNNEFHLELAARKPRDVRVRIRALPELVSDAERRQLEETGQIPFGSDINLKLESDSLSVPDDKPVRLPLEPFKSEPDQGGRVVSAGLVCVLEDTDSRKRDFYWIDIATLHPNEYVKPEFAREVLEGEVKIQIKALGALFPPGGSEVELELLNEENPRSKKGNAKLDDAKAQDFVSVKLDPDRRKNLLVRLHVDGYPRAFVYEVDVTQNRAIPRRGGLREIRVSSPRKIYAPRTSIPIMLTVDAPSAFRDPETRVELAWRPKQVGAKPAAPPKKFFTERDFHVTLEEAKEDGTIVLRPQVSDFEYALPTAGLENDELQVTARLIERERADLVSEPLLVVIDGTPPVIEPLDSPDRIEIGQPLKVAARVSDESRIEKVEFGLCDRFDPDKFESLEAKKEAVFDQDRGVYVAQLTTEKLESGETGVKYSIVARARNENLEKWQFQTKPVVIMPKSAKAGDKMGGEILGSVTAYGESKPGAVVTLAAKDNATAAKITAPIAKTADADGKFKFDNLPPGTYTLHGSVKSGAYTLRGKIDVIVQGPTAQSVKLELKM